MANYDLIEKNEKQVRENFNKYLKDAFLMIDDLITFIENRSGEESKIIYSKLKKQYKRGTKLRNKVFEELFWNLSKDQPILGYLRWYVSCIDSLDNIKSIYVALFKISYFYQNNKNNIKEYDSYFVKLLNTLKNLYQEFLKRIEEQEFTKYLEIMDLKINDLKNKHNLKLSKIIETIETKKITNRDFANMIIALNLPLEITDNLKSILKKLIFAQDYDFLAKLIESSDDLNDDLKYFDENWNE